MITWIVMACEGDGCAPNAVDLARAAHWDAQAAVIGFLDPEFPGRRQRWSPINLDDDAGSAVARFPTQRACLRALRRSMPEGDEIKPYNPHTGEGWQEHNVTHGPDYVEVFDAVGWVDGEANMMRTYFWACFQEAPRVG